MRFPLIPAYALLAASVAAQAPDGFRTHQDPAAGVSFYYPTDYAEIPLQPTEQTSRAKYVRKTPVKLDRNLEVKPAFEIFVIEPDPAAASRPSKTGPQPPGDDDDRTGRGGPKTIRDAMVEASRVSSFDEFRNKRLGGWKLKPLGAPAAGFREWSLLPETGGPRPDDPRTPAGYCAVKDVGEGKLLGVFGRTIEGHRKEFEGQLRRIGKSLKVADDGGADRELEGYYRTRKFRDAPKRIQVRRELARGWKASDTENFILVMHTSNERLVSKVARDLEAVRPVYLKLFPPARQIDAVSIVRICKDVKEYMSYGAPPGSGGFWHPGNEELVLFDYKETQLQAERTTGRRLSDKDSMIVLYHEAFHQYVYYAVGQIAPHDWFNEGNGDYFSGAVINDAGALVRIGPSPWRLHRAMDMASGKLPGWVETARLVKAPRQEYYNPAVIGNYYACGWAFVYFLREAPEAKAHAQWSKILETYFEVLKQEYGKATAKLGEEAGLRDKEAAGAGARDLALKKAFEGVDMEALDAACRAYYVKFKDPWPELRPSK
ncbi:MAG TPA: hypothetical protein VEI02_01465 [Planctomycetota bacterium]|nr:hypothetical protein [Planctomycetota bacterium]